MAKKKHHWLCGQCEHPCEVYKKGKSKKTLVCPTHGIIAHNPSPFKKIADIATDFVPGGRIVKNVLGVAGLNPFDEKEKQHSSSTPRRSYSTEDRVRDALR